MKLSPQLPPRNFCHDSGVTRQANSGFTLIDLMVTVSIISILIFIGATTIHSRLPQYRLSGAARTLMTDLMRARMESVSQSTPAFISFTANRYVINGKSTSIPASFKGVSMKSTGEFFFMPTGTATSPVTITLTGEPGLAPRLVDVSLAGRVRIR